MITQLRFRIDADHRSLSGMSHRLYGGLVHMLGDDLAARFHETGATPLSQYVAFADEAVFWHIHLLDDETKAVLLPRLLVLNHLPLTRQEVPVVLEETGQFTPESFLMHHFQNQAAPRRLTFRAVTPTAFRHQEAYAILPDPHRLLAGLTRRLAPFLPQDVALSAGEIHFDEHVYLSAHRIQSAAFYMKSVRIPGFIGTYTLSLRGGEGIRRLLGLISASAAFLGVGIKTALGMGGSCVQGNEEWTPLPPCDIIDSP